MKHHLRLWTVCKTLPEDYAPWGEISDDDRGSDCSCGCRWYYLLEERDGQQLSMDWGVCANPKSHRCGLLTFEHQAGRDCCER